MGLFKRKTKVTPELFIERESSKALGEKAEYLVKLFSACKTRVLSPNEVVIFSGFMPLLAMSLARLDGNIQRGYTHAFGQKIEAAQGNSTGVQFQERALEYLSAFDNDVAEGDADKLPSLISAALNNIVGTSDETVVLCRLGLLQFILPSLKSDVKFFGELKFVNA